MLGKIKYDQSAKHKKSKSLKNNIAVKPVVIISISSALILVVLVIIFWLLAVTMK